MICDNFKIYWVFNISSVRNRNICSLYQISSGFKGHMNREKNGVEKKISSVHRWTHEATGISFPTNSCMFPPLKQIPPSLQHM